MLEKIGDFWIDISKFSITGIIIMNIAGRTEDSEYFFWIAGGASFAIALLGFLFIYWHNIKNKK
jgi:hypothetical protein